MVLFLGFIFGYLRAEVLRDACQATLELASARLRRVGSPSAGQRYSA